MVCNFREKGLQKHKEDIPVLIEYFLHKHCKTAGKLVDGFSNETIEALLAYEWSGNVRELSNCIEYAVNVEPGRIIQKSSLPQRVRNNFGPVEHSSEGNILILRSWNSGLYRMHLNATLMNQKQKRRSLTLLAYMLLHYNRKLQKYGL